jgi:ABC-2 type transport system permease protein
VITLTWAYAKAGTLELFRYPSFSIPTLLFPAAAFVVFGTRQDAPGEVLMSSYAAVSLLTVAFFQFGVGIANERVSPWQVFLRVLPAPTTVRFAARIVSALTFGLASAAAVVVVALVTTTVALAPADWLVFVGVLLLGSIPFGLLGIALGYWLTPRGALPTANLVFLGLSFSGGLFSGSDRLPEFVADAAPFLPTTLWRELLAAAVGGGAWNALHSVGLVAYATAFALLAAWGYRRDEGERFR